MKLALTCLLVSVVYAQRCSNTGLGPCFNSLCPNGYTCLRNSDTCCQDSCVIPGCEDAINPNTGKSDCPSMAAYCRNSAYLDLMKRDCPKTCGYCQATCADKVNPSTGKSDCPSMAAYCNHSAYADLMATECPKTCGKC